LSLPARLDWEAVETGLSTMTTPSAFFASETLRDGRAILIRAIRPDDREGMLAAIDRTSAQSMFRRFFGARRKFSEREIHFFLKVDFVDHVAIVAEIDEDGKKVIAGGARYIKLDGSNAEVAFAVVDSYQGQRLGTILMRQIAALARAAGLRALVAEVLPENTPMLKVMEKSGLPMTTRREAGVVHVTLALV
jgi:RimJ/RimL family protein N-acetyltransferase